jgi:hypothetical protein
MRVIVSAVFGMLATLWAIKNFIMALQAILNFADTVLDRCDAPNKV